jgi:O-antigen ligase
MILGASLGLNLNSWSTSTFKWKVTLCIITLFFTSALIITQSRAAVAVGALLCFSLILLSQAHRSIKASSLTILIIIITLMFHFNVRVVQKQFNALRSDSKILFGYEKYLGQRALVWNVSFEALRFNPLFGVGNGNWHHIKEEDLRKSVEARGEIFDKDKYVISVGHSHSVYLSAAIERGLIGFIALIILAIGWLSLLKKSLRYCSYSPLAGYIWAGSFSGWLTTFGIGFVNSTFHHEHAILAMLLLGLHISFSQTAHQG